MKTFENDFEIIPEGEDVFFQVENQDRWGGDLHGILLYLNGEFVIETINSGLITIGKGYDAYSNTIRTYKEKYFKKKELGL